MLMNSLQSLSINVFVTSNYDVETFRCHVSLLNFFAKSYICVIW